MFHLPPQHAISASFLTSHFRSMIISVNCVSQAIFGYETFAVSDAALLWLLHSCLSRLLFCFGWIIVMWHVPHGESTYPLLWCRLHWLPIAQRIEYKTLKLAFQVVHCTAPSYLCTLVDRYRSKRELRSGRGAAATTSIQVDIWESGFYNSCPKTVELSPRRTQNDIRLHWIQGKTKKALVSIALFQVSLNVWIIGQD